MSLRSRLLAVVATFCISGSAFAAPASFTIQSAQSSLTLSGNVSGNAFSQQTANSLVTRFTGLGIQRARLASRLELNPGEVHVMDVSSYATPMQMLFVQSAIDWVNAGAENTIVVVPEAPEDGPVATGRRRRS